MQRIKKSLAFICAVVSLQMTAQSGKAKSYIISKEESYTIDVRNNLPAVVAYAEEKKWVGDKHSDLVTGNRIPYTATFEDITEIDAYSISPTTKKKEKVRNIMTDDASIEEIFDHDMKFKYYYFNNLEDGSETYTSYRKVYKKPQFLDAFYFRDNLDCKNSKLSLKVSNDVEIGYLLQGNDTDKIKFSSQPDGDYTRYVWEMPEAGKDETAEDAPERSYYSPHVIFYIKNYKNSTGRQNMLGSVETLYDFYYHTIKGINKTDQTALKALTAEITKGLTSDSEKTRAIFNYVQAKINYVAFERGMGGFIPRDAAEVLQKKYGDCKDMANLLNEMLTYAGVQSHVAWIGTRNKKYRYEEVPTPIVDNHMIAVAKIDGDYVFLDATEQYVLYPGFTPFIQGKQALLRVDEKNFKIVDVPVIPAGQNLLKGKVNVAFEGNKINGHADLRLAGFLKSQMNSIYKSTIDKNEMLKTYLSHFINSISLSNIAVAHDDLTQEPLAITHDFALENWSKEVGGQLIFKPALFFPFYDSRIDVAKRTLPIEFQFNKGYEFEYEFAIPDGYRLEHKPDDFSMKTDLIDASITYSASPDKVIVKQRIASNVLLLEKDKFEAWNSAIKNITKQYNQNIILSKI